MKILLLEDNKKLNEIITKKLKLDNYKVDSFIDGFEAYNNIGDGYNCFVLDINVPNLNGVELLKKIREYYDDIPIIIISATVELDVIQESYHFGCNDFIKKPFFIEELEIKIKKLCNISDKKIMFNTNCYFEYKNNYVHIDNIEYKLTKKEKLLLNLFLNNKNKIITFENIENTVWNGNFVSLESIRSLIRRLRKIIKYDFIETIVDIGYKFNFKI